MRILLISCMRNEGPFLLEWLAHHRAAGVTDFLVFSNDCADGTDEMLDTLETGGVLTHVRNRHAETGRAAQWQALADAWAHPLRAKADWIMTIDCDEFVNIRAPHDTLAGLIGAMDGADLISMPWRLFGNNRRARLRDALTLEQFTRAAPQPCPYPFMASSFKTLFSARAPVRKMGVHRPRLVPGAHPDWRDGSNRAVPEAIRRGQGAPVHYGRPGANSHVQLNHYSLRSAESYMIKRLRGLPSQMSREIGLDYWIERNFNMVEDTSIARMVPATRAALNDLRARVPAAARLHDAAVAWHRACFARLMQEEDSVRLYGHLLYCNGQSLPADADLRDLIRWRRASLTRKPANNKDN